MVEKNQQGKVEIEPGKEWGLAQLQQRVRGIYEQHDIECEYGPDTMLAKLVGNVTTLTHAARKTPDDLKTIDRSLTNVLIWTTTIANIANLDLQEVMQEKFGAGWPTLQTNALSAFKRRKMRGTIATIKQTQTTTLLIHRGLAETS